VQLSLVVLNGKHAGRTIRVKESEFSIGRESDCDLRPKSKRISRRHCIILVEPQRVVVRDLDSRNGTFVNGEKIEAERSLNNRDRLAIGQMKLEVQLTADATATTGSPPPAAESQPTVEAPAETASISGIAFSILESDSSDDDFELTEQSAEPQASTDATDDEPTESFTWPNGQQASTEPEQPETAEDLASPSGDNPADHEVSEKEKEKARKKRPIVGVSKATQAKRVTDTSNEAAAEALRKFYR